VIFCKQRPGVLISVTCVQLTLGLLNAAQC